MSPFAIEFEANEWDAGDAVANPNARRQTYRVLVDDRGARAFIATTDDFGGFRRVDGDAPLIEGAAIATALRGYHRWWMEMRCQMPGRPNWDRCNGIEIVKIGTVKREA